MNNGSYLANNLSVFFPSSSPGEENLQPNIETVVTTIIYSIIFFTGLIGNICTCVVIGRNKSLHTATNYYLFNLAISDLFLLLWGLPQETYTMWHYGQYVFGGTFCIVQGFMAETSTNATVLTITAFTIERYLAICHPFLSYTISKLSRVVKYVFFIWLLAFCLAAPQVFQFGLKYEIFPDGEEKKTCTVIGGESAQHAFVISSFLFFVGPMTVITVLYVFIAIKLNKTKILTNAGPGIQRASVRMDGINCKTRGTVAQKRVIKMLVAVVIAFFVCWAPFHAQRLIALYMASAPEEKQRALNTFYVVLLHTSGVLYYLSTTINPLLYHIMSKKFREAFKITFGQMCQKRRSKKTDFYLSLVKYQKSFRTTERAATDYTEVQEFRSSGRIVKSSTPANNENNKMIATTPLKKQDNINNLKETNLSGYNQLRSNKSPPASNHHNHHHNQMEKTRSSSSYRLQENKDESKLKNRFYHFFYNKTGHFKRQGSVESSTSATNTISNSSLQDVDDNEFTSSDLVRYMEQINSDIA